MAGTRWLVLIDRGGFGARVTASLRAQGAIAIAVAEGDRFDSIDGTYTVRAAHRGD